jgi:hypothetical protein
VFGEDVTEADVLRLALDQRLRLSIYFVNHVMVRFGRIVAYQDVEWAYYPPEVTASLPNLPDGETVDQRCYMSSIDLGGERYLNLDRRISPVRGLWDLRMVGNERIDVEARYQMLTGGPSVDSVDTQLYGIIISNREGQICQLQIHIDAREYKPESMASHKALLRHINEYAHLFAASIADSNVQSADPEKYFEENGYPVYCNYTPAFSVPADGVLVVRTDALRELEASISGAPASSEKLLTTTERNTLLTIIAMLCEHSGINPTERGAAVQIAKVTEEYGAPVTDDTVRKVISQIPEALASRKK